METLQRTITPKELSISLGCSEPLTEEFIKVVFQDIMLFDKKQHDYGPGNIAAFGERGVVVRLTDKLARLHRLVWDNVGPENESVLDTYADVSVYGVIARLCNMGMWPGVAGTQLDHSWLQSFSFSTPGSGGH